MKNIFDMLSFSVKQYIIAASSIIFAVVNTILIVLGYSLPVILGILLPICGSCFYVALLWKHVLISKKVSHDFLTGISNREHFFNELEILENKQKDFHLILIDINKFKQINDALGHSVGDDFLREFAKRLLHAFRKDDVIARIGGDEFAVIIKDCISDNQLPQILTRVASQLNAPLTINEHFLNVKCSLGIATFIKDADNKNDLMIKADAAMYFAKREGSNFFIFNKETYIDPTAEAKLIIELQKAIENRELEIVFQPKICLKTKKVIGAEILSRWNHPQLGFISPDTFIRIAERENLIDKLLDSVLINAFKDLSLLNEFGFMIDVSINVSADNLRDINIITNIIRLANNSNINLNHIILEVTETAILKDPEQSIKYLVMLNSLGIKLSIDDFGTGNSSFIYLKHLPIHEIKIDKTFINDMLNNNTDLMIISSTIHLAKSCGITVVAEGVESAEQLMRLEELNCDQAQGYLISRPLSFNDFVSFMKEHNE